MQCGLKSQLAYIYKYIYMCATSVTLRNAIKSQVMFLIRAITMSVCSVYVLYKRNACVTQAQRMRNVCVMKAHVPVRTSTGSATHAYRKRNVRVPQAQRTRTANATYAYRKRNAVKFLFVSTVHL